MQSEADGNRSSPYSQHPIDLLVQEHNVILDVLAAAERETSQVASGAGVRKPFWASYLDFLTVYTDQCHHSREDVLFAELEACGLPRDFGPTHAMRSEHESMRKGIARLREAIAGKDSDALCRAAWVGIDMLREHIAKENDSLFPAARRLLDLVATTNVQTGFARVEHERVPVDVLCRYEHLARMLCEDTGACAPT
ncbi:MAG: hemerythrin domain-containing protein [Planctomycetota bacterium]